MITSNLMGGLGNYLFQIAAGYSKSLDLGVGYVINPNIVQVVHKPLESYLKNIFRNITLDSSLTVNSIYNETNFHFNKIPDFLLPTMMSGYFQSEKYFMNNEEKIRTLFECPNDIKRKLLTKYDILNNGESCSIHVRRGDYLKLSDHHPTQNMDYYEGAISIIGREKNFLIFSDDIEWCKNNFNHLENKVFCESNEDYEDLYLMSLCDHNIIANSSFSWWGSWLNKNKNKIVVGPKKWFGPSKKNINTDDLYFDKLIKI
jgi:hypothetical protein